MSRTSTYAVTANRIRTHLRTLGESLAPDDISALESAVEVLDRLDRTAPRRGPEPTAPCGSSSALRRHEDRGEEPCPACKEVRRQRNAAAYQRRKARLAQTS